MRDETYIINLEEYESLGTHWVALYVMAEIVTYFDSFVVEHIPNNIQQIFTEYKHVIQ